MKHLVVAASFAALVAALFGGGVGCGEDELDVNHSPNIVSLVVVPENPAPGDTAEIRFVVLDVDGDPLTIRWETTGGQVVLRDDQSIWQVPDDDGTFEITLVVSDGTNTDRRTIDVLVWRPRPGNYYPLAVGNEWIFEDARENVVAFRIIDTIEIENTDVTTYVLETETSDPDVPEGVVNFSYIGRAEGEIQQHAVNVVFGSPETLIFVPWLPLYRFPFIPGKSWKTNFRAKLPDGFFIGEGTATYRVVDESTVTTPAGTFEHVFQIEEVFEWRLLGETLDRTVSRKWLAPDVGIVQIDQEQTRGEQTESISVKLASYHVNPDTSFDLIPQPPSAAVVVR